MTGALMGDDFMLKEELEIDLAKFWKLGKIPGYLLASPYVHY